MGLGNSLRIEKPTVDASLMTASYDPAGAQAYNEALAAHMSRNTVERPNSYYGYTRGHTSHYWDDEPVVANNEVPTPADETFTFPTRNLAGQLVMRTIPHIKPAGIGESVSA